MSSLSIDIAPAPQMEMELEQQQPATVVLLRAHAKMDDARKEIRDCLYELDQHIPEEQPDDEKAIGFARHRSDLTVLVRVGLMFDVETVRECVEYFGVLSTTTDEDAKVECATIKALLKYHSIYSEIAGKVSAAIIRV